MDKQELIEFLDGEIRSVKDNIAFKEGMNWCAQLVERYLDLNEEPEITAQQAWEKIAEIFDDDDPDMLKDVCMNVLKAFNGGYPMLVTEGHICTWNPDVEKPEIPHWLAERTEEYNIDSSVKFWRYVFNGSIFDPEERAWILDNDDIINKIFLCGYTVKEPVWVVKEKESGGYLVDYKLSDNDVILSSSKANAYPFKDKQQAESVATLTNNTIEERNE